MNFERPNSDNATSIQYKLRKKRFLWIEGMLRQVIAAKGGARILDVGGRARYWKLLDPAFFPHLEITIINLEAEDEELFVAGVPDGLRMTFAHGDGCSMPQFEDKAFDLCHSNSVIEHVGSMRSMIDFANESRRVGLMYYHQTPDVVFPIEPHYGVPFLHWVPSPIRAELVFKFKLGYGDRKDTIQKAAFAIDHTQIVSVWMMRQLFPDALLKRERYLLLPKSIVVMGGSV